MFGGCFVGCFVSVWWVFCWVFFVCFVDVGVTVWCFDGSVGGL